MKKFKGIMLAMFCFLFSGLIAFAACSKQSGNGDDSSSSSSSSVQSYNTMLNSITVDSTDAKTTYNVGETFSADGLVVTATTSVNKIESRSTVTDYTVDSSEFDSSKTGSYTIYVAYALSGNEDSVQYASYTVKVVSQLPAYANMQVTYSGTQQYTYDGTAITIDLSADKITAKSYVGDDAANLTETAVTDYDLYYSIDSGELTKVEGTSITATCRGNYSFYVVEEHSVGTESIEMMGQFVVYVIDDIQSIVKVDGGTLEFDYGATTIGKDWTYTLTYASGTTKTLSSDDVSYSAINTSGSQTITISYTDTYTALNSSNVITSFSSTKTTTVTYTVKDAVFGETVGFKTAALTGVSDFEAVTYSADDVIETNDVFTLVSNLSTTTSIGTRSTSDGGDAALLQLVKADGSKSFSYSDIDGNTVSPDQGIKFSSLLASGGDSGTAYTLTATQACRVQLYMTLSSGGYNSDRPGTIYYTAGDDDTVELSVSSRTVVTTISVVLKAGDVLTIGMKNTGSSSASIWLFGAQGQPIV